MFFWSIEKSIQLAFIQPGNPTHNTIVENFNGKFHNEGLDHQKKPFIVE